MIIIIWIVFIRLEQKNKLESHKKLCENKRFSNVFIPFEDTKILGFSQYHKSDKAPFTIYADLESLIGKIDGYKNNLEKSSATKVSEHIHSGFLMSTISSVKDKENKHDVYIYRGKDSMKKWR